MRAGVFVISLAALGCEGAPPPEPLRASASAPALSAPPPAVSASAPPPAPPPRSIVVSAVGDCTLGGDYHTEHPKMLNAFDVELLAHKGDLGWFFSGTRDILAADDLTIANLETTLTEVDEPEGDTTYHFRGKPSYARVLALGSVEVVNLANNHTFDFGEKGYRETVAALAAEGIGAAGYGRVDKRIVKGVEIVNLGYTGGSDALKKQMREEIARHKKPDNLVIVSFHWGIEGSRDVLPLQKQLGHAAIDAGADLVLGTHPHVIQAIEEYGGRHIVYSLGNFVFGGNVNPKDKEAIVYQETFTEREGRMVPAGSTVIPVRVTTAKERNDFRPVPLEGDDRERVLLLVKKLSDKL
jgi:poly-gamma-glutamate synthesis protein (capsule biosynthesis protein)